MSGCYEAEKGIMNPHTLLDLGGVEVGWAPVRTVGVRPASSGGEISELTTGREVLGEWLEIHLLSEFIVCAHEPIISFLWAFIFEIGSLD